jgi:quinol monooxygenase YgiN
MPEIVATLQVQPGKETEFEEAAKEMIKSVSKEEPGALVYSLHRVQGTPGKYVFYEQYTDQSAIDLHGKTAHMAAFGGKIGQFLAGRPELQMLELVAGIER